MNVLCQDKFCKLDVVQTGKEEVCVGGMWTGERVVFAEGQGGGSRAAKGGEQGEGIEWLGVAGGLGGIEVKSNETVTILCLVSNRDLMESEPVFIWMDNFSKMYNQRFPGVDRDGWRNCLWAGVAFKRYQGLTPICTEVKYDLSNRLRPAMPDALFDDDVCAVVWNLFQEVDKEGEAYLEKSLCRKYDVRTIPLKIYPDKEREPELYNRVLLSPDGLRGFLPQQIIAENIGSNIGLIRILKTVLKEHPIPPPQGNVDQDGLCPDVADVNGRKAQYRFIKVDMGIYHRIMKVGVICLNLV